MKNVFTYLTDNKNLSILAFDAKDWIESSSEGCLTELSEFLEKHQNEYRFGFISYTLNTKKDHNSSKKDRVQFPTIGFFIPNCVVEINAKNEYKFVKGEATKENVEFLTKFIETKAIPKHQSIDLKADISEEDYSNQVQSILDEIAKDKLSEVNFCQEFFAENSELLPFETYFTLNKNTKAPFSCFVKWEEKYLLCASPERFLQKIGNRLVSQPIKGTAKRGATVEEDNFLKEELENDEKERFENILTTKLVQQELAIIGEENVAEIEELCEVYTFQTVHQLISTVSTTISSDLSFSSILEALFPMSSMVGVPKSSALKYISKLENFSRGLYSGSVGYFKPNGDFDFNVVIRSILYNEKNKNISCPVGGAITAQSIPEKEYEECLIKIEAIRQVLKNENSES